MFLKIDAQAHEASALVLPSHQLKVTNADISGHVYEIQSPNKSMLCNRRAADILIQEQLHDNGFINKKKGASSSYIN